MLSDAGGAAGDVAGEPPSTGVGWGGTYVDPNAAPNAPTMFGGSETATNGPVVVYPLDASMHPQNIADVTIQWRAGSGTAETFRLRFQKGATSTDVFVSCKAAACTYQMPPDIWRKIAAANSDQDVSLVVSAAGAVVRSSAPVRLHFSPGSVAGGLYYWSTSSQGLYRLTFGQRKAVPYDPTGGQLSDEYNGCIGCHSVSRDGRVVAWGSLDLGWGIAATSGTGAARHLSAGVSSAPALNPDGTRMLMTGETGLVLVDVATGQVLTTVDTSFTQNKGVLFPEWSPDGSQIAVSVSNDGTSGMPDPSNSKPRGFELMLSSEIAILPFNNGQFGPMRVVVPSTSGRELAYYPSWSPDGKWIVFTGAPTNRDPQTYLNRDARLYLVAASGGRVYDLGHTRSGVSTAFTASWPKVAPFSQADGNIFFVGFSSDADYGVLLDNASHEYYLRKPQIWFSAIDLRQIASGDPSWAPIWLPFQETSQTNHLPQWSTAIQCLTNSDCGELSTCVQRPDGTAVCQMDIP